VSAEARTWWGWHRLADRWAARLVEQAGIAPGDLVLDIGAGTGAITDHLVAAGARVIAFELHPARAHDLRVRYARANVKVVQADATDLRLPGRSFQVVANPPFAITTALLHRLLGPRSHLDRAELVVPRYVARRWGEGRDRDARRWTRTFDVAMTARVPRSAFRPPAPDDAAQLSIVRRSLR
jgi:23S rRNA (adenine-N6)-dimethyltransferase